MSQRVKFYAFNSARILLGLIYFVFGLNFFFQFLGSGPHPTGPAESFINGLFGAGYFFPMMKSIEVVGGLALLMNRFVPLTLVVLMPITVNIFLFHLLLAGNPVLSIVMLAMQLYLAWVYREHYSPLFEQRAVVQKNEVSFAGKVR